MTMIPELEVYLTTYDGAQHLRLHGWLKRNSILIKSETINKTETTFGMFMVYVGNDMLDKLKKANLEQGMYCDMDVMGSESTRLDLFKRSNPEIKFDWGNLDDGLDEKSNSPTIKVAEGVSFIATANIGSEYTATRIIDRALLDRFAILEMDVLSYEQEYQLLSSKCTVNQETLLKLCDIIKDIRKEVKSDTPRISTTVSTRATLEIAELLEDAFTLEQAIEILVYPLFSDEGGNDSERTYVKQVVQKYLTSNTNRRVYENAESKAKKLQDVIKTIGG